MTPGGPPEPTDRRKGLLARLLAAIFGIAEALRPVMATIGRTRTRPWTERARLSARFWAVIREVLALAPRIALHSIAEAPSYPPLRPGPPRPGRVRPPRLRIPEAILSPRQLARRLAALLQKLIALAAEARLALTPKFHHLETQLRTIAGCNALPPHPWESTA